MLERIHPTPLGTIGFRAKGVVTREDYNEIVEPILQEQYRSGIRTKLLVEIGDEFEGFTAGAAWEDFRVGFKYIRLIDRCAIITDQSFIRGASQFIGSILTYPVKVFKKSEEQAALDWLNHPEVGHRIEHKLLIEKEVILVEPKQALSKEDFQYISHTVDSWIEHHSSLRGLVLRFTEFPGWENLGSMICHLEFIRSHHQKIKHVAVVTDTGIAEYLPKFAAHFLSAEIKHFPTDHFQEAIDWASSK